MHLDEAAGVVAAVAAAAGADDASLSSAAVDALLCFLFDLLLHHSQDCFRGDSKATKLSAPLPCEEFFLER